MPRKRTAEGAEKPYRDSDKFSITRGSRTIKWIKNYPRNKK